MRLRSIAWAGLAGLAAAAIVHSSALVFASLAGSALAALVLTTRRRVFTAFTFERALSRRVVTWGAELEITMSVTNAKFLPLVWMRVHDEWPEGLEPLGFALGPVGHRGTQAFIQTVSVRWYERLRRHYRVRCAERGLHRFGPVELEAGDPFGLAGVSLTFEAREELAVLPKILDIPDFELLTGRPLVEETASHSLTCDPTALRGIRAYRPGDPMRAINWRATARRAELHTNEFDPASLAAVRLLLDLGVSDNAWQSVDPQRTELMCVVTASLAAAFAARGFGVGLVSNARLVRDWRAVDIEPAEGALPEVLETLACVLSSVRCDLGVLLAAELASENNNADCVVVTTALRPGARGPLTQLRTERPTTVVYVGRPTEDEAPFVDVVIPDDVDWRTSDALPLSG